MLLAPRLLAAFLLCVTAGNALSAHEPVGEMLGAAQQFLNVLTPEQKQAATFPFADAERENWHFIPKPRAGLPLAQMSELQQNLAFALLRSGLSQRGFARAEAIVALENVLKEIEAGRGPRRDPTLYYVTVFGTPAPGATWAWRFEGHHLSFNFTIVDGRHVFFAPSFMGSNPAEVRTGPQAGLRILGEEDDDGRALVTSFDEAQREIAVISSEPPGDVVTGNARRIDPLAPAGLRFAQMNTAQRARLRALVKLYAERLRPEIAAATLSKIENAGFDKVRFAWAGGFAPGDKHYYRIQGPTFLVEFDDTQNQANHIHTVWRDFDGDFGRDLLREHYERDHAK